MEDDEFEERGGLRWWVRYGELTFAVHRCGLDLFLLLFGFGFGFGFELEGEDEDTRYSLRAKRMRT